MGASLKKRLDFAQKNTRKGKKNLNPNFDLWGRRTSRIYVILNCSETASYKYKR